MPSSNPIQRYGQRLDYDDYPVGGVHPMADGKWVRHEDHLTAMQEVCEDRDDLHDQLQEAERRAIEAEAKLAEWERGLGRAYANNYAVVADLCDDYLDRSGALLGRVRKLGRATLADSDPPACTCGHEEDDHEDDGECVEGCDCEGFDPIGGSARSVDSDPPEEATERELATAWVQRGRDVRVSIARKLGFEKGGDEPEVQFLVRAFRELRDRGDLQLLAAELDLPAAQDTPKEETK